MESFVKHWLYNILGASWHWFRYEFSVLRGGIHVHGLAKLKNDPGLTSLAKLATDGYIARMALESDAHLQDHTQAQFEVAASDGLRAEKEICHYHDLLISTMNPIDVSSFSKPSLHPCKLKFAQVIEDLHSDYIQLVNTVQRHSKCNSGYCLKQDVGG